jgi:hypothetical protein
MPSYIVRVDREEPPVYVMWSEIVDDITAAGTREEIKANRWFKPEDVADERFDRADATGTSDMYPDETLRTGTWADSGFVCQQMWLPRHMLRSYAEARQAGGDGRWILEEITE